MQARIAGADVKSSSHSRSKKTQEDDAYGKTLEFRKRMKDAAEEFADFSDCTHPL